MVTVPARLGSIFRKQPLVGRVPKGAASVNVVIRVSAVPSVDGICEGSKPALAACHVQWLPTSAGEPSVTLTPWRVTVEPMSQPSAAVAVHAVCEVLPN